VDRVRQPCCSVARLVPLSGMWLTGRFSPSESDLEPAFMWVLDGDGAIRVGPARTVICANGARPNYCGVVLEVQFSTELNDSRIESGGNLAESAIAKIIADGVELGVIPGVERFEAQLEAAATLFAEDEVLEQ
jgi:hypothetical protein